MDNAYSVHMVYEEYIVHIYTMFTNVYSGHVAYNLCKAIPEEEMTPMCLAQQKVLQGCPEFINGTRVGSRVVCVCVCVCV